MENRYSDIFKYIKKYAGQGINTGREVSDPLRKWVNAESKRIFSECGIDRVDDVSIGIGRAAKYWWIRAYKDVENALTLSIFFENIGNDDAEDYAIRVAVELYGKKGNDHLDELFYEWAVNESFSDPEIQFFVGGSNSGGFKYQGNDINDAKEYHDRTGKRIQPSYIIRIEKNEEETTGQILSKLKLLLPYYTNLIEKVNSLSEKNDENNIKKSRVEEGADGAGIKKKKIGMISSNTILYGPPGTGKTYNSVIYAVAICDDKSLEEIQEQEYSEVLERYKELREEGRIAFTTFHQSYGYEEFIEGIKPLMDDESEDIGYSIVDGVFKAFCSAASEVGVKSTALEKNTKPYVFIIDEINRGNISKIFGELITLIETTKRRGAEEAMSATLPYSQSSFSVPDNVYILGTMNTADRSIALMDTALRRRFDFVEMMPDSSILTSIGADRIEVGEDALNIAAMLDTINDRISYLFDREHTIGHAFFTGLRNEPTIDNLADIFLRNVIPLLQEYFYEDYSKIQLVLGDNGKDDEQYKFIKDSQIVMKDLFKGNPDLDLGETKYEINQSAFYRIQSYLQI